MRIDILIFTIFNFLFTIYYCDLIQKQTRKINELKEKQIYKMARCIMKSGIDCCFVCDYYNPEEQSRELPEDVEPCLKKRKLGECACIFGIKKYFKDN